MRSHHIDQNVFELEKCCGMYSIQQYLDQEFDRLNLGHYFLSLVRQSSMKASVVEQISNYPDALMGEYREHELYRRDPALRYSLRATSPVKWQDLHLFEENKKENNGSTIELFTHYLFYQAAVFPFRLTPTDTLVFYITCETEPGHQRNVFSEINLYYPLISHTLVATKELLLRNKNDRIGLTGREKECLFWACEGKTAWEISKITDIGERTVNFHLNNVSEKLGASNRQHAVVKAVLLGVIAPSL